MILCYVGGIIAVAIGSVGRDGSKTRLLSVPDAGDSCVRAAWGQACRAVFLTSIAHLCLHTFGLLTKPLAVTHDFRLFRNQKLLTKPLVRNEGNFLEERGKKDG